VLSSLLPDEAWQGKEAASPALSEQSWAGSEMCSAMPAVHIWLLQGLGSASFSSRGEIDFLLPLLKWENGLAWAHSFLVSCTG